MTEMRERKAKTEMTETCIALDESQVVQYAILSIECAIAPCDFQRMTTLLQKERTCMVGKRGQYKKIDEDSKHDRR